MTDELRAMAASVGMEIPQAATLMMSAADTIDRLDAENAKLRELCKAWREFAYELFDEFIGEPELNEDFMALDDRMCKLEV